MGNANYRGTLGENFVAEYLESKGYFILEKNYKCAFGEVDIIAKNEQVISFTEVKTRLESSFGEPCEAVNLSKQRKIIIASALFLKSNPTILQPSFDVYEVVCRRNSYFSVKELRIHKNAFSMNEKNCRGLNFI